MKSRDIQVLVLLIFFSCCLHPARYKFPVEEQQERMKEARTNEGQRKVTGSRECWKASRRPHQKRKVYQKDREREGARRVWGTKLINYFSTNECIGHASEETRKKKVTKYNNKKEKREKIRSRQISCRAVSCLDRGRARPLTGARVADPQRQWAILI